MACSKPANPFAAQAAKWKSPTRGRTDIPWTKDDAEMLARGWLDELPKSVQESIKATGYKGDLVNLSSDTPHANPTEEDIKRNGIWVRVCLRVYRSSSPSGYLIGDALMLLNAMLDGGLYKSVPCDQLHDRVLEDAAAIRRLCAHMRELFRNSCSSRDPFLSELKSYMTKKPKSTSSQALRDPEDGQPPRDSGTRSVSDDDESKVDSTSDSSEDSSSDDDSNEDEDVQAVEEGATAEKDASGEESGAADKEADKDASGEESGAADKEADKEASGEESVPADKEAASGEEDESLDEDSSSGTSSTSSSSDDDASDDDLLDHPAFKADAGDQTEAQLFEEFCRKAGVPEEREPEEADFALGGSGVEQDLLPGLPEPVFAQAIGIGLAKNPVGLVTQTRGGIEGEKKEKKKKKEKAPAPAKKAGFKTGHRPRKTASASSDGPLCPVASGIPEEAWPQGPRSGLYNYTVKGLDKEGGERVVCVIEVQMKQRKFYVRKAPVKLSESPSVAWSRFKSVKMAWRAAKKLLGHPWYPKPSDSIE